MRDQTAFKRADLAAGKAGRRHHWRLADMMVDSITDLMLKGWFLRFFMEGERLPMCPRRRILWLVEVRAGFSQSHDSLGTLMASAAIRREALRLRRMKRLRQPIDNRRRHFMVSRTDGPRKGITGNSVTAESHALLRPSPKLPPQL